MIRLSTTQQEMRTWIGAGDPSEAKVLTDPLAPSFCTAPHVHLEVVGHARDDLFPVLKVPLTARFSNVPPSLLTRDLLAPLKNGLGNAYKRGNEGDRSKSIRVEMDVTLRGAVIALTDEGAGFDVAGTLQRFRRNEHYFNNHGAGFRIFERSKSCVSYANEGRTFLLCFRVNEAAAAPATPPVTESTNEPPIGPAEDDGLVIENGLLERVRVALATCGRNLVTRRAGRAPRLEAGGILAIDTLRLYGPTRYDPMLRCVLRGHVDGRLLCTVLTGRRFISPEMARADFDAGRALRRKISSKKMRVPEPIVCLESDRLALYAFDPWMDLWTYVKQRGEAKSVVRLAERLGAFLGAMHREVKVAPEPGDAGNGPVSLEHWKPLRVDVLRDVGTRAPQRQNEAVRYVDAVARWRPRAAPALSVPTHGHFGADSICYGVDGRFYLWGYEHVRRAHPGIDVGTALADLYMLTTTLEIDSPDLTRQAVHDTFLQSYARGDTLSWQSDVSYFVLAALLRRVSSTTFGRGDTGALLGLCSESLDRAE